MDGYLYVISIVNTVLKFLSAAISKEFGEKQLVLMVNLLLLKIMFYYKGKIYWFHVKITYEEGASYVYRMYSLNIEMNIWGMHSVYTGRRKRSMCLTLHCNRLICLVNDGFTSIWCIDEIQDFKRGQHCVQQTDSHFEDGRGLRWTLLQGMTRNINIHCSDYLPFRAVGTSILMCKNAEIPFIYYDLETCSVTHLSVDERSSLPNQRLPLPANNQCSNIIMYKNFFPLTPGMVFFNDFLP